MRQQDIQPNSRANRSDLIVITGPRGFIGRALTHYFYQKPFEKIRAIDKKPLPNWFQTILRAECLSLALSEKNNCTRACEGSPTVYNLAADRGGIGFI